MFSPVKPIRDKVIIEKDPDEELYKKMESGLFLPKDVVRMFVKGLVVAVGTIYIEESGNTRPVDVKVGDTVLYHWSSGTEYTYNDKKYLAMKEDDILGVVED